MPESKVKRESENEVEVPASAKKVKTEVADDDDAPLKAKDVGKKSSAAINTFSPTVVLVLTCCSVFWKLATDLPGCAGVSSSQASNTRTWHSGRR